MGRGTQPTRTRKENRPCPIPRHSWRLPSRPLEFHLRTLKYRRFRHLPDHCPSCIFRTVGADTALLTVLTLLAATTLTLGACTAKPHDSTAARRVCITPASLSQCGSARRDLARVELPSHPVDGQAPAGVGPPSSSLSPVHSRSLPAKCDGNVLISGSTVFGGDGSTSARGDGLVINNGDGAGSIVEGPITITYGGDGSRSHVSTEHPKMRLFIFQDGGERLAGRSASSLTARLRSSQLQSSIVSTYGDGSEAATIGKTTIYNEARRIRAAIAMEHFPRSSAVVTVRH